MAPSLALRLTARCQYGTETVKFIFVRDSQASNIDAIISKEKEEAGIESFDPDPGGIKRLNRIFLSSFQNQPLFAFSRAPRVTSRYALRIGSTVKAACS